MKLILLAIIILGISGWSLSKNNLNKGIMKKEFPNVHIELFKVSDGNYTRMIAPDDYDIRFCPNNEIFIKLKEAE